MATSGITVNQLTRNQFIETALRTIAVLAIDQTPSATEYTNALVKLNALLGEFRSLGMALWARTTFSFPVVASTSAYNIGTGQTLNTPYPLKMLQAYRTDSTNSTHVPMEIVANFNYNLFPTNSSGSPIQLNYQPKINLGVVSIWPTPNAGDVTSGITVNLVYTRPYEYFSAAADTLDMAEEWVQAVIYGLAVRIAPEYGVPIQERQILMSEYKDVLANALSAGTEDGSLFFQPDSRSYMPWDQ